MKLKITWSEFFNYTLWCYAPESCWQSYFRIHDFDSKEEVEEWINYHYPQVKSENIFWDCV